MSQVPENLVDRMAYPQDFFPEHPIGGAQRVALLHRKPRGPGPVVALSALRFRIKLPFRSLTYAPVAVAFAHPECLLFLFPFTPLKCLIAGGTKVVIGCEL